MEEHLKTGSKEKIVVLNPVGFPPQITQKGMAPRLANLDGKVVYLVDLHFYDSGNFLSLMQNWFSENLPGVKTLLVQKKGQMAEDDPQLFAEIRAKGDAMIMAVGH
jgi:hypothetical protein